MEPMLPTPNIPRSPETTHESTEASLSEVSPNTQAELPKEKLAQMPSNDLPLVAPVQDSQNPVSSSDDTVLSDDNSSPQLADDVDVIEKEWVNKAKKIVNETKDDPYQQEKAVSKLQADYLLKRYGKQLKVEE